MVGFQVQNIQYFIEAHRNGATITSLYKEANVSREVLIGNFRRLGYDCTGKHPVQLCKGNCGKFVLTIGYEYCHDCKERLFHSGENNVSHRPEVRKKISEKLSGRIFSEPWMDKLSENHHLRGKTYEEAYGDEVALLRKIGCSKSTKGKTYEEISGIEQGKKRREMCADSNDTSPKRHQRFLRGEFKSYKNNCFVYFASSYELRGMVRLDHDDNIVSFKRCSFSIPYYTDDQKYHRYTPDLEVIYIDGSCGIIEIKPLSFLKKRKIQLKSMAGTKFCNESNFKYIIWTEDDLPKVPIKFTTKSKL